MGLGVRGSWALNAVILYSALAETADKLFSSLYVSERGTVLFLGLEFELIRMPSASANILLQITAAEVPVKSQCDTNILTPDLAPSKLCEIPGLCSTLPCITLLRRCGCSSSGMDPTQPSSIQFWTLVRGHESTHEISL